VFSPVFLESIKTPQGLSNKKNEINLVFHSQIWYKFTNHQQQSRSQCQLQPGKFRKNSGESS